MHQLPIAQHALHQAGVPSAVRRRRASHAGSWYSASAQSLRRSLTRWLESAMGAPSAHPRPFPALRAIIAPHAGYSYSGRIAAYAYAAVDASRIMRVFVLGPSHHVYLQNRCALSGAAVLDTPLGPLPVDVDTVNALYEHAPSLFQPLALDADENEHSVEMHLPYLRHVFTGRHVNVVPVVVGNLSEAKEREIGAVLAPWLADESTLFVISSDFCHWGTRFDYVRYEPSDGDIWQSIEKLDRQGMRCIESGCHHTYAEYQQNTENTVCGRHPIGVLMGAIAQLKETHSLNIETRFVKYDQSSKCRSMDDSSVSYASAWAYLTQ